MDNKTFKGPQSNNPALPLPQSAAYLSSAERQRNYSSRIRQLAMWKPEHAFSLARPAFSNQTAQSSASFHLMRWNENCDSRALQNMTGFGCSFSANCIAGVHNGQRRRQEQPINPTRYYISLTLFNLEKIDT